MTGVPLAKTQPTASAGVNSFDDEINQLPQLPQPDIHFTTVPAFFAYLRGITDDHVDAVTVADVTPAAFDAIDRALQTRGRKARLFFLKEHGLLIVTLPNQPHEALHLHLYHAVVNAISGMGLFEDWASLGATRLPKSESQTSKGEGDSGGTPFPGDAAQGYWPTIVVEAGYTQSLDSMRTKMRFWFAQSAHRVNIVVLAKAFPHDKTNKRILIEQWQERAEPVRPGATTTRRMASAPRQPVCVQTINIVWAVPGLCYDDASQAQRCDPRSFNVVRGPLRLEFARLFLRQPAIPNEQDIVLTDDRLQRYAVKVWY